MHFKAKRCDQCLIPPAYCVCKVAEPESVATRVTVVIHFSDVIRATNTGKFVPLVLANSEVLLRGVKGDPLDMSRAILPDHHNLLLYPSAESVPLTPAYVAAIGQPINVIVPDGNWNQAGKMVRREQLVHEVPHVYLNVDKPSRYRLRTAAHENWISTFEAVARALGIIENPDLQQRLEYFFDVAVERILFLKGQLPREKVTGGITSAMIRQYHTDNEDQVFLAAHDKRTGENQAK